MSIIPAPLRFFFKDVLTKNYLLKLIIFSLFFLLLSLFLINIVNFVSVAQADYPLLSKIKIFAIFLAGSFETVSGLDLFFLVLTSFLFSLNLSLVLEKIKFVRNQGNLNLTIGAGIISIASAGCASCGLSIVSFVGLGAALAALPLGGIELYIFSILILILSFIYNLNSIYKACKITK